MTGIRKILVTGGAGYIGSVLVPKLLGKGYEVTVFDSFSYSEAGIKSLTGKSGFTIIKGDILDVGKLAGIIPGHDCIIHLAAISNDPSAELDPSLTRRTNLDVYPSILETAKASGVKRFINPSSIGVYGINYDNDVTEKDPVNPLTEYARCKVSSEQLVQQFANDDFVTVSMRCGTVCGWSPRMRFDLSVNTLTAVALKKGKLTVWGGEQKRPQIHIEDITDFFTHLVSEDAGKINGKIFNAAGQNSRIIEIAETIKKVLNGQLELESAPPRDDERSYHVNSDLIKKELGLSPKRTIEDAVRTIVDAYNDGLWTNFEDPIYNNVKKILQNQDA